MRARTHSRAAPLCPRSRPCPARQATSEERGAYQRKLTAQLATEKKAVKATSAAIRSMRACLDRVIRAAHAADERVATARDAAEAAAQNEAAAASTLGATLAASRAKLDEMTVRVSSEADVTAAQEQYVKQLDKRLQAANALRAAHPGATQPPDAAAAPWNWAAPLPTTVAHLHADEPDDDEKQGSSGGPFSPVRRSLSMALASLMQGWGGGHTDETAGASSGPLGLYDAAAPAVGGVGVNVNGQPGEGSGRALAGTIGRQLLMENDAALGLWAAELREVCNGIGEELCRQRDALSLAESRAASEIKALSEKRTTQLAMIGNLERYEGVLEMRSPRAAAASPRRTSPQARPSAILSVPGQTPGQGGVDAAAELARNLNNEDGFAGAGSEGAVATAPPSPPAPPAEVACYHVPACVGGCARWYDPALEGLPSPPSAREAELEASLAVQRGYLESAESAVPLSRDTASPAESASAPPGGESASVPPGGAPGGAASAEPITTEVLGEDNDLDARFNPDVIPRWRSKKAMRR